MMEHTLGGDANSLENTDKLFFAITFCSSCVSEQTQRDFCALLGWRERERERESDK